MNKIKIFHRAVKIIYGPRVISINNLIDSNNLNIFRMRFSEINEELEIAEV